MDREVRKRKAAEGVQNVWGGNTYRAQSRSEKSRHTPDAEQLCTASAIFVIVVVVAVFGQGIDGETGIHGNVHAIGRPKYGRAQHEVG